MFLAGPDAGDAFAPGDESGRDDEADASGGEVPAVAADTTGNGDGAKRRRRRGRRGGRRGDAARVAGEPGAPEAAVPALTAMDGGEGESDAEVDSTGSSAAIDEGNGVAGTAGGPGETGQKRRRRRHRSRRHSGEETAAPGAGAGPADYGRSQPRATLFESSVPQSAAPATVAPSRAPAGAIPAGNAGDEIEDIPGGWWQKLTGGSRRGGRGPGRS